MNPAHDLTGDPAGDLAGELAGDLAEGVRRGRFGGASAAWSGADGRVHRAAAGTVAPGDPTPVTPATRADLGPLTRVWTAAVAHELAQVGAVDLDRPTARGFTPRQLLEHTSGLPAGSDAWRRTDLRPAQKLQRVLDSPLLSAPGEVVRDSDVGFVVLGDLLEDATGQGLDSLVEEFVTLPLGLDGPRFGPVPGPVLGAGSSAPGDELARSLARPVGHTGLRGTAGEVHALGRALLAGTLGGGWRTAGAAGTGSPGASLVLDPAAGTCRVLLTDRPAAAG
ncbi:serine hydrolase domain-containing protein [Kineococcus sp. SYSU DK002]|uniref:serine hydrolase domain-containing protein n=1 Tax=Kineococcus sp. SYSU DK002 TaxID=3383123 RepID=UPI003D7E8316